MAGAWRHLAITWTNTKLSPNRFCGTQLRSILLEVFKIWIGKISLKNILVKLLPHRLRGQWVCEKQCIRYHQLDVMYNVRLDIMDIIFKCIYYFCQNWSSDRSWVSLHWRLIVTNWIFNRGGIMDLPSPQISECPYLTLWRSRGPVSSWN